MFSACRSIAAAAARSSTCAAMSTSVASNTAEIVCRRNDRDAQFDRQGTVPAEVDLSVLRAPTLRDIQLRHQRGVVISERKSADVQRRLLAGATFSKTRHAAAAGGRHGGRGGSVSISRRNRCRARDQLLHTMNIISAVRRERREPGRIAPKPRQFRALPYSQATGGRPARVECCFAPGRPRC
jgi:hypothetical protein